MNFNFKNRSEGPFQKMTNSFREIFGKSSETPASEAVDNRAALADRKDEATGLFDKER